MKISRRDLLRFAVGSAAGVMLTPVPWKVLDDSAIWTQNWPWIPVPTRGESTTRFTTCTLCPAACGVRARCVAGQPVSLAGVAEHPLSNGTLCPVGFGAHHLPYHPCRVIQPVRRSQKFGTFESTPLTPEEAADAVAAAIKSTPAGETVAILDQQPGRSISSLYRRLLSQIPNGVYLRPPMVEDATLAASASIMGLHDQSLGFDLENARTVVSFGAPLFDGWGTPGRMMKLAGSRRDNSRPTTIQIETRQSRTALQADEWVPIKPGTDGVFALGLAHVLVQEKLSDLSRLRAAAADFERKDSPSFGEVLAKFTPEKVSAITGIGADRLRGIARSMAAEGPTIVLGAGDPAGGPLRPEENLPIASLNFLLGGVGQPGGIVLRPTSTPFADIAPAVAVRQIQDLPDRSIRVFLLDGAESGHALPWSLIERKLADEKALVVSLSPYSAGISRHAEIIIPSPAFLESLNDVPTPFDSPVETFSVSAPLVNALPGTTEPADTMKRISLALGLALDAQGNLPADVMKTRARALHASGRGSVFTPADRKTVPLKDLDSAETLWSALIEGGCWLGDATNRGMPSRLSFFGDSAIMAQRMMKLAEAVPAPAGFDSPLVLMPYGWRGASGSGQVSPLMSKVYQESGLRECSKYGLINPETGKARGISEKGPTVVETKTGSIQVLVHFDASVMPDVLHVAVGPDETAINAGNTGDASELLSKCLAEDGRSWRLTPAKVSKRTV